MICFANDNAHCYGKNCPKRDRCMRYVALIQKQDKGGYDRLCYFAPKPETCTHFLEIREVKS